MRSLRGRAQFSHKHSSHADTNLFQTKAPSELPELTSSSNSTAASTITHLTDSPRSLFSTPVQQSANSTVHIESSDTGSEEDTIGHNGGPGYTLSLSESRVLTALGNDWILTACWFTKARSRQASKIAARIELTHATCTATNGSTSHGTSEVGASHNTTSISSSSDFRKKSARSQQPRRIPDKVQEGQGNRKVLKKRKRGRSESSHDDEPPSDIESQSLPHPFACHFHKLDPATYCLRTNKKFKQCPALTLKSFRRIKQVSRLEYEIFRLTKSIETISRDIDCAKIVNVV